MMKFCTHCKKELDCVKNGLVLKWGVGHCYSADRFKCPTCGIEVYITAPKSFFQTDTDPSTTIQMD